MPSSGPLYAGTGADDAAFGTDSWTNPGNIVSDNATYAETDNVFQYSHYLKATNFSFAVPAGATINGIVVEIERLNTTAATTNCVDARVRIVKGGTVGTTDKADTVTTWPETATVKTYGSSSDLWGETWTVADINASNFGVVLATEWQSGFYPHPSVDFIRITVYYTEAATGGDRCYPRGVSRGIMRGAA